MKFGSVERILTTIAQGDDINRDRSANRAKVTNMLNGGQLITNEEAAKLHQEIKSNFKEACVLFAHAIRQMDGAFLKAKYFFRVLLPKAPKEVKTGYETGITEDVNEVLKDSAEMMECIGDENNAVIAHGIAPVMWKDDEEPIPEFIAIDDLRIPTDTKTSMTRMPWFAWLREFTIGELIKMAFDTHADTHWNKPLITKTMALYKDDLFETQTNDMNLTEEKILSAYRQGVGFLSSDKAPTVKFWSFYYKDDDTDKWNHKMLAAVGGVKGEKPDKFFYEKDGVADSLGQLLHVQYGDLTADAPRKYHAVRSLGYLLFEPCFWSNQMLCRKIQHAFENMNILLKQTTPAGKARPSVINLFNSSILPEGTQIVPSNERHQVNLPLVESVQAQLKQLMNEAATQYNQSIDNGTQKERTAYEVAAMLSLVNAMMSNIMIVAFGRKKFQYQEIARRFCIDKSNDKLVKLFREKVKARGIPDEWIDIKKWKVEIEVPAGAGNPTMATAQANWLMQNRMAFSPQSQQEILNFATSVMTDDSRKGAQFAPMDNKAETTPSQKSAESDFTMLMRGHQPAVMDNANVIDQVTVLIKLLGEEVQMGMQDGLATARDVWGMHQVEQHIGALLQQMQADPARQERAKAAADALGKISNDIRTIEQAVTKKAQDQAKAQQDATQVGAKQESDAATASIVGKATAAVQMHEEAAASKMKLQAEQAGLKNQIKADAHQQDQNRADQSMMAEENRKTMMNDAQISRTKMMAEATPKSE